MVTGGEAVGGQPAKTLGPERVSLPASMRDAIVAHARAEQPLEACGLIVGDAFASDGGRPLRWEPTRNRLASAFRYEIHPDDLYRLLVATDDANEVFWAIVHSHTHTPAVPSTTDVNEAQPMFPEALYLVASLAPEEADPATGRASLLAWRIVEGVTHEIPLTIEG